MLTHTFQYNHPGLCPPHGVYCLYVSEIALEKLFTFHAASNVDYYVKKEGEFFYLMERHAHGEKVIQKMIQTQWETKLRFNTVIRCAHHMVLFPRENLCHIDVSATYKTILTMYTAKNENPTEIKNDTPNGLDQIPPAGDNSRPSGLDQTQTGLEAPRDGLVNETSPPAERETVIKLVELLTLFNATDTHPLKRLVMVKIYRDDIIFPADFAKRLGVHSITIKRVGILDKIAAETLRDCGHNYYDFTKPYSTS